MSASDKTIQLDESLRNYCGEISFYGNAASKPLIGISGNFRDGDCTLAEAYWDSVLAAGGTPVIIPPYNDVAAIDNLLAQLDGLLLSGGADIDPEYLGEEPVDGVCVNAKRDFPEMVLIRLAVSRKIPILGICRGMQMLAAALGGKLYQDIYSQHTETCICHSQNSARHERSHKVSIQSGSLLHSLMKTDELDVNSFHHQAVKQVPQGFEAVATAPDGIIEAMESTCFHSIMGVQWHPECMHIAGDDTMMPILTWLVQEAALFGRAKRIHDRSIILDSHCDTPMFFDKGAFFHHYDEAVTVEYDYVGDESPDGSPTFQYTPLVSLRKMTEGRLDVSFMVAYLKQMDRDTDSLKLATAKADRLLSLIEDRISRCKGMATIAKSPDEVRLNKRKGVKSIVLGIENGYAIGLDLNNIGHFAGRGVAYITLCHNGDNDICDSAKGNSEHNGLSDFGKEALREMNRYGIMPDLSHASEKSFYDAIQFSSTPVICSHSCARALCDHPRNLTDDQMRTLANSGGVAQACLYHGFVRKGGNATIADAVRHIMHMIDVMGITHVGIGSDFDGGGGIAGIEDASAFTEITRRLLAEGLTDEDLHLVWGENFLNVWQRISAAGH